MIDDKVITNAKTKRNQCVYDIVDSLGFWLFYQKCKGWAHHWVSFRIANEWVAEQQKVSNKLQVISGKA